MFMKPGITWEVFSCFGRKEVNIHLCMSSQKLSIHAVGTLDLDYGIMDCGLKISCILWFLNQDAIQKLSGCNLYESLEIRCLGKLVCASTFILALVQDLNSYFKCYFKSSTNIPLSSHSLTCQKLIRRGIKPSHKASITCEVVMWEGGIKFSSTSLTTGHQYL